MRKIVLLLFTLLLPFLLICAVYAQDEPEQDPETAAETEAVIPLPQRFGTFKFRDRFENHIPIMYYRFSPDVWFYDPIDLSYFPHEKWNKSQWVLLGRWTDSKTYNQILYTDLPTDKLIIHGTDTGAQRGFLKDFYLYATLFVEDNYPKNTGSCYVYYSDSLLIGFKPSKGLLIDPQSGIYEATSEYGGQRHATYTPTTIKHTLEMIKSLNPENYPISMDSVEGTSIGAGQYVKENLDDQFVKDWTAVTEAYRMNASPEVKAYRVEVIRENGVSTVYINGQEVYSAADSIRSGKDPERVSWSYGPMLNVGGLTVTCSIGDFMIYTNGQ